MTQNEIIDMARQAEMMPHSIYDYAIYVEELEAFAKLVAEKEREACAELRKTLSATPNKHIPQLQPAVESALDFYAKRILARGQE